MQTNCEHSQYVFYCICIRYESELKRDSPSTISLTANSRQSSSLLWSLSSFRSEFDRRFKAICFHLGQRIKNKQRKYETRFTKPLPVPKGLIKGNRIRNSESRIQNPGKLRLFSFPLAFYPQFLSGLFAFGFGSLSYATRQSDKPQVRGVCNLLFGHLSFFFGARFGPVSASDCGLLRSWAELSPHSTPFSVAFSAADNATFCIAGWEAIKVCFVIFCPAAVRPKGILCYGKHTHHSKAPHPPKRHNWKHHWNPNNYHIGIFAIYLTEVHASSIYHFKWNENRRMFIWKAQEQLKIQNNYFNLKVWALKYIFNFYYYI